MEYNHRIRTNQQEFINNFKSGIYGILYGRKIDRLEKRLKAEAKNSEEVEQAIICYINRIRIRRIYQSVCQKMRCIKFKAKHYRSIKVESQKKTYDDYFSIAVIVKNEADYLKEWIDFHLEVGTDTIYLFDNGSTDATHKIVQPYIDCGKLVYIYYPGDQAQLCAYNCAVKLCKNRSHWLAFLDADEFLFAVDGKNIARTMKKYDGYCGIGVNWIVFGPSGNKTKPSGGVRENYTMTFEDRDNELNCRIKTIAKPEKILAVVSPHNCIFKGYDFAVDENGNNIVGNALYTKNGLACTEKNHSSILRINHYWTKSEEELRKKCQRGYPDGTPNPQYDSIMKRLNYPLMKDTLINELYN